MLLHRLQSSIPEFDEMLESISMSGGCTAGACLILPVQRLPRYILFMERLCSHAPNVAGIARLNTKFSKLLTRLNQDAGGAEDVVSLQWKEFEGHVNLVSARRRILKRGELRRFVGKTGAPFGFGRPTSARFEIVLLSDVLLAAARQGVKSDAPLKLRGVFPLHGAELDDIGDTDEMSHAFNVTSCGEVMTLFASSATEKAAWLDAITDAIADANADALFRGGDAQQLQLTVSTDLTVNVKTAS